MLQVQFTEPRFHQALPVFAQKSFMSCPLLKKCIKSSPLNHLVIVGHPKILSNEGIKSSEYILSNFEMVTIEDINRGILNA